MHKYRLVAVLGSGVVVMVMVWVFSAPKPIPVAAPGHKADANPANALASAPLPSGIADLLAKAPDTPPPVGLPPPPFPVDTHHQPPDEQKSLRKDPDVLSIGALIDMPSDKLRQIVEHSDDPPLVQSAVWAMGNRLKLNDQDVNVLLQRLAINPPEESDVRKTILWAMSLRPDRIPVNNFTRYALHDPVAEVRRTAVRTLSVTSHDDVASVLKTVAVNDDDPQNRGESLFFLTTKGSQKNDLSFSQHAFSTEKEPAVRMSWVAYIGNRQPEGSQAFLDQVLYNTSEEVSVRQIAADMIVQSDPARALKISADESLPARIRERFRPIDAAQKQRPDEAGSLISKSNP